MVLFLLGDFWCGYCVVGISDGYFEYYCYGVGYVFVFVNGWLFDDLYDVVIGVEVV